MAKANDLLSNLGVDVQMTSEGMETDVWANNTLRDIGKTITGKQQVAGQQYLGSFAVHLFADTNRMAKAKYEMGSITQIAIDDVSEHLVTLGFNNAMIALRKYFNPDFKSGRRNDKR
jgi:hypothetical protein